MELFINADDKKTLLHKDAKENKTKTKEHEQDSYVQICFNTAIIIISYFR